MVQRLIALFWAFLLSACIDIGASDAVRDEQTAIIIGQKACAKYVTAPPDSWHARLEGDNWQVWTDYHGLSTVSVSKLNGVATSCAMVFT
jgi:hypothetical protein